MAETIGSLCDKLTIVQLKQFHSEDKARLDSLAQQEKELIEEIDSYINDAVAGKIPAEKLTFDANKVFKKEGNDTRDFEGGFGIVCSTLSGINCKLWHEQEKVYEFEKVSPENKDIIVKQLAILNLERNKCIEELNNLLLKKVKGR